ncbi:MAG TPA: hypothetical protein VFT75_18420 [Nocardioidaceae bacterium]|nr:hypothetical protein [Nocardioidaceae bacterium]
MATPMIMEVCAQGHRIKVLHPDHPVAQEFLRRFSGYHPTWTGGGKLVCTCACGAAWITRPSSAAQSCEGHGANTTRPIRPFAQWTNTGWTDSNNHHNRTEPEMKPTRETRKDLLRRQLDRLTETLARLEQLPEEPEGDPTQDILVIYFDKTFGGSQAYAYAAVKAGNGLWYTTGLRAPKGYPWDDLVQWINQDEPEPVQLLQVTAVEPL